MMKIFLMLMLLVVAESAFADKTALDGNDKLIDLSSVVIHFGYENTVMNIQTDSGRALTSPGAGYDFGLGYDLGLGFEAQFNYSISGNNGDTFYALQQGFSYAAPLPASLSISSRTSAIELAKKFTFYSNKKNAVSLVARAGYASTTVDFNTSSSSLSSSPLTFAYANQHYSPTTGIGIDFGFDKFSLYLMLDRQQMASTVPMPASTLQQSFYAGFMQLGSTASWSYVNKLSAGMTYEF